jgi:hypothetical protein
VTVTVIPPGSRVKYPPAVIRLPTVTVTVVLVPAARVPADGETDTAPIRPCDSVMDQVTGPPEALRVRVAELPGSGVIVIARTFTDRVPGLGGGLGEGLAVAVAGLVAVAVARLVDGTGEPGPGAGLAADGRGPGAEPPAGPVAAGGRPAVTEGNAFADTVGCAELGPPGRSALAVTPVLAPVPAE